MILQRMDLPADVAQGMVEFVHNQASLLQGTGAPLPLLQLLRGMNDETWMVIEGSETVTETVKGARPGEATADLIFIFLFARVTMEAREALRSSEFQMLLPYSSGGWLSDACGRDAVTDALESCMPTTSCMGFCTNHLFSLWGLLNLPLSRCTQSPENMGLTSTKALAKLKQSLH